MKTPPPKYLTLIQAEAIASITALRFTSGRCAMHTICGRLSRSVRPIRRRFEADLGKIGFTADQIYQAWLDILDMVRLHDNAEEDLK